MTPSDGNAGTARLLKQHADLIGASAISPQVSAERQYRSVSSKAEIRKLGFSESQSIAPTLLIPIYDVQGELCLYQHRPDTPRIRSGKALKYETPAGSKMRIDVPPRCGQSLCDPKIPLWITEGVRKADSAVSHGLCCIDLLGVWNWRGTNDQGGKTALPDWESIALNGREVNICFDSDVVTKPQVADALMRLKQFLESRRARVSIIKLSDAADGGKQGLDDFLAAGGSVSDLFGLAVTSLDSVAAQYDQLRNSLYEVTDRGLVYKQKKGEVTVEKLLANFSARIVSDIVCDDGQETIRHYELEVAGHGETYLITIPVSQFPSFTWVAEKLGHRGIISPGTTTKDHLRAAIQELSEDVEMRRVFTHLGWTKRDRPAYLSASGAIGECGAMPDLSVKLNAALDATNLIVPSSCEEAIESIQASLRLLDVADNSTGVILLSAVYRAPLGAADFAIHLTGRTGNGKSELAALAQQHWGPHFTSRNLPGSWSSTANALEILAYQAKDTLLVVDDFLPRGTRSEIAQLNAKADRLLRAQGNNSGRQRLNSEGFLRQTKPPRGMILSTGEDIPSGSSLQARLVIVEIDQNCVRWDVLTELQRLGAEGTLSKAMAAYVQWLAPRLDRLLPEAQEMVSDYRRRFAGQATHKRSPDNFASLMVGMTLFLRFALDHQAICQQDHLRLLDLAEKSLLGVMEDTSEQLADSDPAKRFLEILASAISGGNAHIAGSDGDQPKEPQRWGWRRRESINSPDSWQPMGDRVGWIDGDNLFLDPSVSYRIVQRMARDMGETFPIASRTLRKRLFQQGLLLSVESCRGSYVVRRTLGGARRNVIHVNPSVVLPGTDQTDQSDQTLLTDHPSQATAGQFAEDADGSRASQTDHEATSEAADGSTKSSTLGSLVSLVSAGEGTYVWPYDQPCETCGGKTYWRDFAGSYHCAACDPPTDDIRVDKWINTDDVQCEQLQESAR
ncbi:MAG: DUF3854 domain-containing protein [Armatimonadota bacterium]